MAVFIAEKRAGYTLNQWDKILHCLSQEALENDATSSRT